MIKAGYRLKTEDQMFGIDMAYTDSEIHTVTIAELLAGAETVFKTANIPAESKPTAEEMEKGKFFVLISQNASIEEIDEAYANLETVPV